MFCMTSGDFFDFLDPRSVNMQKSIVFYMKNVTATRLETHQTLCSPKVFILDFGVGRGPDLMFGSWPVETLTFSSCFIAIGHTFGQQSTHMYAF